jgi:hypothetical protein
MLQLPPSLLPFSSMLSLWYVLVLLRGQPAASQLGFTDLAAAMIWAA